MKQGTGAVSVLLLVMLMAAAMAENPAPQAAAAARIEAPLYHKQYDQYLSSYPVLHSYFETRRVEGGCKLPEKDMPCYVFELGGKPRYVGFGKASRMSGAYTRMYADLNGNNDLTDDGYVDRGKVGPFSRLDFFPIRKMSYKLGDAELPYEVQFYVRDRFFEDPRVTAYGRCAWAANPTVDGRMFTIEVGDQDGAGLFSNRARRNSQADDLHFSSSGLVIKPAGEPASYYDAIELTDYIAFGDKLYALDIDLSNKKLTLKPADIPLVPLKIPPNLRHLQMVAKDGAASITFLEPPPAVQVPKGVYWLASYSILAGEVGVAPPDSVPPQAAPREKTLLNGMHERNLALYAEMGMPSGVPAQQPKPNVLRSFWLLTAEGTTETQPANADGSPGAEWTLGEPYNTIVSSRKVNSGWFGLARAEYQLSLELEGQGKERVSDLIQVVAGRETVVPAPAYRIVTGDGEAVAAGLFRYG